MKKLKKLTIIILAITLLIAGYFAFLQKPEIAAADWWDDSWLYRQTVEITNSGTDQTDFQVMITLDSATLITANKMQSDCDDIRITDISGKLIPHWIEPTTCNTATTKIWTKVPSISTSGDTVYLYYGNSAVNSKSSTTDTFIREISGVQGAWDMDGTVGGISTGDTLADSSGNSNTGTASNVNTTGMAYADSQYGQGVDFDGVDDYVDVPDNDSLDFGAGTDFSISVWFKGVASHTNQNILSKGDAGFSDQWALRDNWDADTIIFRNNNVELLSTGGGCFNGNWHHIAVTVDRDGNSKIFKNGNEEDSVASSVWGTFVNTNLLNIGKRPPNNEFFDGSIDNIRIYNTALSSDEISDLYGTGGDRHGYVTTNYPNKSLVRKYSASVSVGSPTGEERGPGPVAFWKFDEGFGQTANDSTINANNGTLGLTSGVENSDPTWQTEDMCVSGKCLKFDGVDDYVDCGDDGSLNITDAITIEAWVKANTLDSDYQGIVANWNNFGGTRKYGLFINPDNKFSMHLSSTGADNINVVSNSVPITGRWYHIAGTRSSDNNMFLYINGVKQTDTDTISGIYDNIQTSTVGWFASDVYAFNGSIDSVKIYPYARTAAQIKADYASRGTASGVSVAIGDEGKKSLSDGLVGYWKMDEASWDGTADEVVDSSGSGNDGIAVGATGEPTTGAGKFGNGGVFDGVDDYVDAESDASLDFLTTKKITISMWFNVTSKVNQKFLRRAYQTGQGGYQISIYSDVIYGTIWNNAATNYFSVGIPSANYNINTWNNIIFTATSTEARIYLNGILTSSNTTPSGSLGTANTNNLEIGSSDTFFNGQIDEVRIYNRALSPGEVRDLYNFAPGPVGWWKMDENVSGDGQTINDSSGYGNTGTTSSANGTGMDCTVLGKYGGGCEFDGVDDYVSIGDSDSLDITDAITISLWLKKNVNGIQMGLIDKEWDTSTSHALEFYATTNKVRWYKRGLTEPNHISTNTIADTNWHHVVVVYTGSQSIMYFDGVSDSSISTSGSMSTSAVPLTVGRSKLTSNETSFFNGSIDDVRIYNYARTQAQIMEDYSAGAGRKQPVGHWKFDEGYGTTANNSGIGGSSLNGTLTNMASPATATSGWTDEGRMGKGLVFDGVDDYVSVADDASLNFDYDTPFSVGLWIKRKAISATYEEIISKYNNATSIYPFTITLNTTGSPYFASNPSGGGPPTGSDITDLEWHFIFITYDVSNKRIYQDGILKDTDTAPLTTTANDNSIFIGKRNDTNSYPFNGSIDDVKIYNYALTEDEVRKEYNQGALLKLGSTGTDSSGNPDDSQSREYCVPGDATACDPPVGEWNFNEGAGSTVNDITGNNNTGTWNGTGSHWTTGKIGKGGSFNGSDDYVSIPNFTLTFPATVIMWVKPSFGTLSQSRTFLSRDGGTSFLWFYQAGINKINLYDGSDNIGTVDLVKEVEWQQIAITFDESGNGYQWYNGQQDLSFSTISEPTNPFELRIGDWSSYNWNGSIDQVRIYDYARTSAQVAWDYNRGKPVAHWKFDECQGGTAYDSSGNANNGTITIGATVPQTVLGTCETPTDNSGAWYNGVGGKVNSSMSFDGSDDYVSVPATELTEYSIGFWAYRNTNTLYEFVIGHDTLATKIGFLSGDDKLFVRSVHGGSSDTSVSVSTGIWNYIVVTRNSNNKIDAYVNGGTANRLFSDAAQSGTFYFNTIGEDEGNNNFNGLIDEVKIYNYALTAEQIKMEYNGGAVRFE